MIEFQHIKKIFGEKEIINDFNLNINPHEFIVVVGPSGCGKSTTLRLLAGLEVPTSGNISIKGENVNLMSPSDRKVSMVFQDYALYPHMTVFENLAFGLRIKKVDSDIIASKVKKAAEVLDLLDLLERKPAELSGGQRQRVAMGRALVKEAQIFLFDEPLSNLDATLRHKMRSEIKRFHRDHQGTTVYVTHDQLEAMTLADRIVVMKDGKIEQVGSPSELFNQPLNTFVASFIGTPHMNLFEVGLKYLNDSVFAIGENQSFEFRLPENKVANIKVSKPKSAILGIRPCDISLFKDQEPGWNAKFQVKNMELLGHEALVTFSVGKNEGVATISSMDFQKMLSAELYFKLQYCHLFDINTQKKLSFGSTMGEA